MEQLAPKIIETSSILHEDLTHETLAVVMERLNQLVIAGNVLHGTRNEALAQLEPRLSLDLMFDGDPITGVFATDRPEVAVARAAYGDRLYLWARYVVFGVKDDGVCDNSPGYIYVVPQDERFSSLTGDASEFVSEQPVQPTTRIAINPAMFAPHIRTRDQVSEVIDSVYDKIIPEGLTTNDVELILLVVNNFLDRIGNFKQETSYVQFELLNRLASVCNFFMPHYQKLIALSSSNQKQKWNELYRQYLANREEGIEQDATHPSYDADEAVAYFLSFLARG